MCEKTKYSETDKTMKRVKGIRYTRGVYKTVGNLTMTIFKFARNINDVKPPRKKINLYCDSVSFRGHMVQR